MRIILLLLCPITTVTVGINATRTRKSAVFTLISSPINDPRISPESIADTTADTATNHNPAKANGADICTFPERRTEKTKKIIAAKIPTITKTTFV